MSIYKFCISTPIWKLKTITYVILNCQLEEVIPNSIQRSNLTVKLEVHTTKSTHLRRDTMIMNTLEGAYTIIQREINIIFTITTYNFFISRSEMTLNYRMTLERYPNLNRGVGNSESNYEIFSLLDNKNQKPTQCKVGSKPHLAPRGSLSRVGPMGSNSRQIARHYKLIKLILFFLISMSIMKLKMTNHMIRDCLPE